MQQSIMLDDFDQVNHIGLGMDPLCCTPRAGTISTATIGVVMLVQLHEVVDRFSLAQAGGSSLQIWHVSQLMFGLRYE
jgi:hypothetical protein